MALPVWALFRFHPRPGARPDGLCRLQSTSTTVFLVSHRRSIGGAAGRSALHLALYLHETAAGTVAGMAATLAGKYFQRRSSARRPTQPAMGRLFGPASSGVLQRGHGPLFGVAILGCCCSWSVGARRDGHYGQRSLSAMDGMGIRSVGGLRAELHSPAHRYERLLGRTGGSDGDYRLECGPREPCRNSRPRTFAGKLA